MPTKTKKSSNPKAKKSSSARSWALEWDSFTDEHNNSILEAVGGTTDGESNDLYYRLEPCLRFNTCAWIEASSPELMIEEGKPQICFKKRDAMKAIQEHYNEIMNDYDFAT